MIPIRMVIPRVGRELGAARIQSAEVPMGEIVRAAALAMTDGCPDPDLRIRLRAAYEAADKDGRFARMEEP